MMSWTILSAAALSAAGQAGAGAGYREGQVWEYRTRSADDGSLLRIQKIEEHPAFAKQGPIYHISVIGVHFDGMPLDGELAHLPVSRQTLDASVTQLSSASSVFPDAEPGISEWRLAQGGVFTIPLAEIISTVEAAFREGQSPQ